MSSIKKERKIEKRENKELEMGSGDEKVIKKNMERKETVSKRSQ